jgi:arabinan endo-1,5-alpha-L-arabinosidase
MQKVSMSIKQSDGNIVNKSIVHSNHMKQAATAILFLLLTLQLAYAQPANIPVHDPVMIKQDNTYYLFCTGRGISVWSSTDRQNWEKQKPVFDTPPAWALEAVAGFKGHIWAPDISFYKGKYYLFYSISAFGKNTSCIGLASNTTLNPADANFKWEDHGKIIESVPGRDLWNAIDPNLIVDQAGTPWLSFGSFWKGIKMVKLQEDLLAIAQSPQQWYTLASRPRSYATADTLAGEAAIEAPFIFKKGKYYYLFVSFDYCCRGEKSTYKMVVGRAEQVIGPYLDRNGKKMLEGGGTLVLQGNKQWYGVGHNSVYTFDNQDYLVFHGYDASDKGKAKLLIKNLSWDQEGWPVVPSANP